MKRQELSEWIAAEIMGDEPLRRCTHMRCVNETRPKRPIPCRKCKWLKTKHKPYAIDDGLALAALRWWVDENKDKHRKLRFTVDYQDGAFEVDIVSEEKRRVCSCCHDTVSRGYCRGNTDLSTAICIALYEAKTGEKCELED